MAQASTFTSEASRWRAVAGRDRAAEGAFYYGVRTTGVYCRPGCASRRPRRGNVEFFATCAEAERAGYRPCKRCRPDAQPPQERKRRIVEAACRRLEAAETPPTLAQLATLAGLSRWHFQRLFKASVGVTPRQYFDGVRAQRLRERLAVAGSVTEALFDAGFGASSSAYGSARAELAMTPSEFRAGGRGLRIRWGSAPCALGWVAIASTGRGICAIELGDDSASVRGRLEGAFPRAVLEEAGTELESMLREVVALIESPWREFDLPLDIVGTAFREQVWHALRRVPPGATVSYAELATRIGRTGAARAVAGACAANPLAVAIPCHRVLRADGGLGGYRWGRERKRALLEREQGDQLAGSATDDPATGA